MLDDDVVLNFASLLVCIFFVEQELFEHSDGGRILALLDSAAAEIKRARDFVSGAAIDDFPYVFFPYRCDFACCSDVGFVHSVGGQCPCLAGAGSL